MIATILKCSKPGSWYEQKSGETFVVLDKYPLFYTVRVNFKLVGFVLMQDVEVTGEIYPVQENYPRDYDNGYEYDPRDRSYYMPNQHNYMQNQFNQFNRRNSTKFNRTPKWWHRHR